MPLTACASGHVPPPTFPLQHSNETRRRVTVNNMLVLVNPNSGTGKSGDVLMDLAPIFEDAHVQVQ